MERLKLSFILHFYVWFNNVMSVITIFTFLGKGYFDSMIYYGR